MKKILFIAPVFFGYYKEIIKELELQGYNVDYFCDSSNNSNIFKALSRINKNFVKIPMYFYYKNEIKKTISNKKYDYVFFVFAMSCSFSTKMIKNMKEIQKDAKFIGYQWDGEDNMLFVKEMHKYLDEIYTFDRIDSLKNKNYKFLPLFYIESYENVGKKKINEFKYDVSYIGTAHPHKLYWINKMAYELREKLPNQFIYHFIPSKLKFYYHKIKNKEYQNVKLEDLNLIKIPLNKMMEIFEESKCILDAPQDGQNGLTIRTIECLGAKRKLITVNKDIKNYDFYCPENILIYDENYSKNNVFFNSEYKELPKEIYEKYSLRNWLKEILK